jgi:hypothetical protein
MEGIVWEAVAAVLVSCASLAVSLRSIPTRITRNLKKTLQALSHLEDEVASVKSSWIAYREAIDGVMESIAASEERADRHRRSTVQAAKRLDKKEAAEAEAPDSEMQLIVKARQLGVQI